MTTKTDSRGTCRGCSYRQKLGADGRVLPHPHPHPDTREALGADCPGAGYLPAVTR